MSLQLAAQHLASKGRGKDTELVHMDKGELQALRGLAQVHGGKLTTNPHTGLPEAGFLSSILPTVIGIGASAFLGPEMLPLIAGGVGLADYAITGSLGQGLMAGLGAWAGGSLGSSLEALGSQAAVEAAPAATEISSSALPNLTTDQLAAYQQAMESAGSDTAKQSLLESAAKANASMAPDIGQPSFSSMGQGLKAVGTGAPISSGFFGANMKPLAAAAAAPLLGGLSGGSNIFRPTATIPASNINPQTGLASGYGQPLTRIPANAPGTFPTPPAQPYQAQYPNYALTPYQPTTMASGGIIAFANRGQVQQSNSQQTSVEDYLTNAKASSAGRQTLMSDARSGIPNAQDALAQLQQQETLQGLSGEPTINYAAGGLGGYSDGGHMLKGPGDGMSDSIPATIGRKQPARLADGEFVVPADVVSHLGNGSTDAGAKRLYSMMDRIRTARTGKKKQAPAVKADKYLPA
jgi:hypothetical protein